MPIEGLPELPGKFAASVKVGPKGKQAANIQAL